MPERGGVFVDDLLDEALLDTEDHLGGLDSDLCERAGADPHRHLPECLNDRADLESELVERANNQVAD